MVSALETYDKDNHHDQIHPDAFHGHHEEVLETNKK
jgi:hypothetical protein